MSSANNAKNVTPQLLLCKISASSFMKDKKSRGPIPLPTAPLNNCASVDNAEPTLVWCSRPVK